MGGGASGGALANGRWRVCESTPRAARRMGIPQAGSGAMDDATARFEILGATCVVGSRGNLSGSGMPLGLDRQSDQACRWADKSFDYFRTYGLGDAGGCSRGGGGDACGRVPARGSVRARESEVVGAE